VVTQEGAGGAGLGKNPAKVGVARLVLDVEEDGAGKGGGPVGRGGNLGPKDRVNPGFPGGEEEFDRGMEVRIGETHRREAQFRRPLKERPDRKKRVMKTVVGADVEGGVGKHLLYKCITTPPQEPQAGFGLGESGAWGKVDM